MELAHVQTAHMEQRIRKLLEHLAEAARTGAKDPVVFFWAWGAMTKCPDSSPAEAVLAAMPRQYTGRVSNLWPHELHFPPCDVLRGKSAVPDVDDAAVAFAAAALSLGLSDVQLVAEAYDRADNFCHVVVRVEGARFDPTYFSGPESRMAMERLKNTVIVEVSK